jgi:N-formylglutamate deformylase
MSGEASFRVVSPRGVRVPVVAHVPHSSLVIPPAVRAEITLTDDELADELLRLTDWHTADLFAGVAELGVTLFVNELSRFVFDPERFLDDAAEPTAAHGQGVVYWRGTRGQQLRVPDPALRERRVDELYRPYHAALDALVAELLADFGECLVLDCHSFPSLPLPSEIDQASGRPDICIGTDEMHTPPELASAMESAFAAEGFVVKHNTPFAGTFVPSGFYGRETRVHSVMIEVRRGLYMDEDSGEQLDTFTETRAAITRALIATEAIG